jgi:hypothetical protein
MRRLILRLKLIVQLRMSLVEKEAKVCRLLKILSLSVFGWKVGGGGGCWVGIDNDDDNISYKMNQIHLKKRSSNQIYPTFIDSGPGSRTKVYHHQNRKFFQ